MDAEKAYKDIQRPLWFSPGVKHNAHRVLSWDVLGCGLCPDLNLT